VLRVGLVLVVVSALGLAVLAGNEPAVFDELLAALGSLWNASVDVLCQVAKITQMVETEVWTWFPGKGQAVLGAFECVRCLLVLLGLGVLGGARGFWRLVSRRWLA
jgi:hypothetical protein